MPRARQLVIHPFSFRNNFVSNAKDWAHEGEADFKEVYVNNAGLKGVEYATAACFYSTAGTCWYEIEQVRMFKRKIGYLSFMKSFHVDIVSWCNYISWVK